MSRWLAATVLLLTLSSSAEPQVTIMTSQTTSFILVNTGVKMLVNTGNVMKVK